jgi:SNF2 family DNA or RNA helicase
MREKIVYYCNGESKNFPSILTKVNNSVTLANYKSGSEAVEFTYADIIIYFSPTESYTEYYQSLGRCHRLGQTNKVTVYRFITLETIEEYIYYALNNKQDFNFDLWEEQQHGQRKRKSR